MARRLPVKRSRADAKTPLLLTVCAATGKQFLPFLRRNLAAAHELVRPPLAELSVALVGDRQMGDLHLQFLGVAGPTDVLTFPLEVDRRGRPLSGEVVVCVPEAKRRAKLERTDLSRELLLYALHGLLHLSGFDDRTTAGYAAMHRKEDMILTQLGIGPVFDRARAESSGLGSPRKKRDGSQATRLHGAKSVTKPRRSGRANPRSGRAG